jgi:hypothetical protein
MTRREKELFAMAIRYAERLTNLPRDVGMPVPMKDVARDITDHLTFEVTDDEITAAVAVNRAGRGERTAIRLTEPAAKDELYRIMREGAD